MDKIVKILLLFVAILGGVLSGCQKQTASEQNTPMSAVPDQISYTLSEDGILEIRGTGELQIKDFSFYNYGEFGADWDTIESIKKIIIHEGITSIGEECFSDFDSLESVELPNGMTKICSDAFYDDAMLKRIDIPDTVEEIGNRAFEGCESLEEFTLPSSLKKYKTNAIKGCFRLKKVINHSDRTWKLCSKGLHGTWYNDEQNVDEIAPGQEVWLQSSEYKITYDLNGGTATGELPDKFTYRDGVKLPDTVEREGYTFAGWDGDAVGELTDCIYEGIGGNQKVKAIWIRFQVEKLKEGKIRAFWDLVDGGEKIPYYEGYSCFIRYSKNPDMSDFDYVWKAYGDTEVVIDKLEKGQTYYVEYALVYEVDGDEWDMEDFPWQGKMSIQ